jgi:hypothetical protein
MTASAAVERTKPYLRPHQVEQLHAEKQAIESMLTAPEHIRSLIQDKGSMLKQVRAIDTMLHEDSAKPYVQDEMDRAARREVELREDLTASMPTQAEMRRAPPGAIDKHRKWETTNKGKILEWKNLRLRLHASGLIDDHATATDVANLEKFRPSGASHELNMDNALVSGKDIYLPPGRIAVRNVMSEEDRKAMLERDSELAAAAAKAAIDRLLELQANAAPAKDAGGSKK